MKLVDNPRRIVRRFSFLSLGSVVGLQTAWAGSTQLQAVLPPEWVQGITLALGVLGMIGAFVDQPKAR